MSRFSIAEPRIGQPRPFGPGGEPSAIDKAPVAGPVAAGPTGLAGDAQGDPARHGGPDKAIHAYPAAHCPVWAPELPQTAGRFRPGGFGENLVIEGATEADICLGDRWQAGAVLPGLPANWRRLAENRLASGRIEDWGPRLTTPG